MSEPTDDEYRDWKDLTASPGWARLKAYAAELTSPVTLERHVMNALDGADAHALGKLRQMLAAKNAIVGVLEHPHVRVNLLKRDKGEPSEHMGRRGAL